MKLKEVYILLIVIILLLISIGSVCASKDISTDYNEDLTSDKADLILTDDNGEIQEKINGTIDIPDEIIFNEIEDIQQVPISIKDNDGNNIEFSESDITITEGEDTIAFFYK